MSSMPVKFIVGVLLYAMATYAAPTNAKSAIAEVSAAGQFLGLIFYEAQDASLSGMSSTIATFNKSATKKLTVYNAKLSDPANKEIADKYGIQPGNLPLVLVIAPNGVVTGGYPSNVTADQLKQCVSISDLMLKTLKPLQEQKVTLVALQNSSTKFNAESWTGVNEFVNDSNYKKLVVAMKADPSAPGSLDFVKQCQLIAPLSEATVVVLLPPGKIGKVLTGKLTKADILKALSSCATGCAPGGCSDRRFKQNVTPITSALEKVTKLQGVTFTWNTKDYPSRFFTDDPQIGVIAQDVENVIPEVVHTDKEGFKSVEYDKLTAVLIEAVKEMKQQMNSQDSIIKVQNAKIKALEVR
jgi:hypothetical protein